MTKNSAANSSLSPPGSLEEIPGLGVVRARGLRKAGFATPLEARNAHPERLAAAPGMTAIKAEQLLAYLKQFSMNSLETASGQAVRSATDQKAAQSLGDALVQPPLTSSPLAALLWLSRMRALTLFSCAQCAQYRGALLRALSDFVAAAGKREREENRKTPERAMKAAREAADALQQAIDHPDLDKKEQARLENALLDAIRRLPAGKEEENAR